MLMRHSVALDNLSRTIPLIDSDQKVTLLNAPFKGTTLFGGELAKLQKDNKECSSSLTAFQLQQHPLRLNTTKPYTGRRRSSGRVAILIKEVAGIEIRIDPPLRPQQLNRPSLNRSDYHDCSEIFRVMRVPPVLKVHVEPGGLRIIRNSQNESVLPPQSVPDRGRLCQFVEGWKHITNDPYVLSILAKGHRLRSPSTQGSLRNKISQGFTEDPENARANIPDALKICNHRDTSE